MFIFFKELYKIFMRKAMIMRVKYQKNTIYKSMVSGIKLKTMTSNEIDSINNYFKGVMNRRINTKWHQYYYSVNNVFSCKYIPLDLYYGELIPLLNDRSMTKAYADKNLTDRLFPDVLQPKSIIKNINGYYYYCNKPVTKEHAVSLCSNLHDVVIKQATESSQGRSVVRFSSNQGKTSYKDKSVEELFDMYRKNFIVQEAVKQHAVLSTLNPTSLNTVRLTTFRRDNDVVVLTSLLRMGRKGSLVDNVSVGGVFCKILSDGSLCPPAYSIKPTQAYMVNDYNVSYAGIVVPQYNEIVNIAKSLHFQLPYSRIIGWDFTVNENNEVVLIELNLHSPGVYQLVGPAFGDYTDEILALLKQ